MAEAKKVTTETLRKMKESGEKISMVTAYDYPTARIVDEAGIEIILVGDSVGNVVLGYPNTVPVEVDEIIHHAKAVMRGVKTSLVVGDMPFMSFNVSAEQAMTNAGRLAKEGGTDVVKLEGGEEVADVVRAIVTRCGIPVMGHIGLTPQRVSQLGGFKVQGKDVGKARKVLADARILEDAGAFALILECVPYQLARKITESVSIPTIGIGGGPYCDGQVLVLHDLLGLTAGFQAKFVKRYANLDKTIKEALLAYKAEVAKGTFPSIETHSFTMNEDVLAELK
ncbi:MAG: 3-methyl-2-oxobutanoate hydroxymethyltransferase [Candidatus Bipolaricaulis sp.]|nr:3-methyl-2-oxobutanoate hydroxymethyltransferase [Candidatus Bipolaricaulis sp.]